MDVVSTEGQPPAPGLDLTPMLPTWARNDSGDDVVAESSTLITSDMNGHYPTLPLPPAGTSAGAMLGMAVALRAWRQWRRRRILA